MAPGASGDEEFGVYVHVPFCAARCGYCAFVTTVGKIDLAPAYVDAVITELGRARKDGSLRSPTTVFIGGGTPSLLPAGCLERLLEAIAPLPGAEVTVEANPESASAGFLAEAKRGGVTRISLGAQSLVPAVLADLDREHTTGTVGRAVAAVAEAGFETFNLDLIYGSVAESDADWSTTLEGVLALDPSPPHISAYALTVEAGTPLAKDRARHPDEDVQARRYEMVDDRLGRAGLSWYEVSNWAKPGHECRHNRACWQGAEYLGFGCAAHSHLDGRRFSNVTSAERYMARIAAGRSAVAWQERLAPNARQLELLELELRTRDGVPEEALPEDTMLDGLVERRNGRVFLTRRGRLLANEVAIRLVAPWAAAPQAGRHELHLNKLKTYELGRGVIRS